MSCCAGLVASCESISSAITITSWRRTLKSIRSSFLRRVSKMGNLQYAGFLDKHGGRIPLISPIQSVFVC
jgi:hypothetical protein